MQNLCTGATSSPKSQKIKHQDNMTLFKHKTAFWGAASGEAKHSNRLCYANLQL